MTRHINSQVPNLAGVLAAIAAGIDITRPQAARYDAVGADGKWNPYVPGLPAGCGDGGCGGQSLVPGAGDPSLTASLIAAKNGFMLAPKCPTMAAKEFLGFPRTTIVAGDTVTITTQPEVMCKVLRLVIPSDIAFQLLVHDFKIGKWSHLANSEPFPAAMIDEQATDVLLDGMTAQANTNIILEVENTSNADLVFKAGCIVVALE